MSEYKGLISFIVLSVFVVSTSYVVSGQFAIALALMIGLFPVVMSIATKKR